MAPQGDDRCIKDSISACGTVNLVPSKLVCNPERGRDDGEGEMNTGDENCGRRSGQSGVKDGMSPMLDMLEGSED